jgi:hypothetical protein
MTPEALPVRSTPINARWSAAAGTGQRGQFGDSQPGGRVMTLSAVQQDVQAGLIGPKVTCRPAAPDLSQTYCPQIHKLLKGGTTRSTRGAVLTGAGDWLGYCADQDQQHRSGAH